MSKFTAEQKHVYENTGVVGTYVLTPMNQGPIYNDQLYTLISYISPKFPTQGTDDNQCIGKKINLSKFSVEACVTLNTSKLMPSLDVSDRYNLNLKMRAMFLRFDKGVIRNDVSHHVKEDLLFWFLKSYVPYVDTGITPTALTGTNSNASVWANHLRESTEYTGKFKILYDKPFKLTGFKTSKMFNISIPLKKSLITLDRIDGFPRDTKYDYYFVIFPFLTDFSDVDDITRNILCYSEDTRQTQIPIYRFSGMLKTIYYDF